MRELIKQYVALCAETLPVQEPVYEFGALQVPGQEMTSNLRPYFPGKKYVGADMRGGLGVDIVLNLHSIDLPPETAGTVIMMDTLEHVEYPRKAVEEVYRILKPDGLLIMSSVMLFPIHDFPYDYWRFTPEAFRSLLKPFPLSSVELAGDPNFPHTVVGIGSKDSSLDNGLDSFHERVLQWRNHWSDPRMVDLPKSKEAVSGDIVVMHYTCRTEDGIIADSTAGGAPRQIRIGGGQLNVGLDQSIAGMKAGDARTVEIPAEKAYGPYYPEKVFKANRSQFPPGASLEAGQQITVNQSGGSAMSVTVKSIEDQAVTLDGNHPLAGKTLYYNIWLINIL